MEPIILPFLISCENCNKKIFIACNELELDSESSYDRGENSMGEETIFCFLLEKKCPRCGNHIKIEVERSEYPVGAYNFDICNITGASFIIEPKSFPV